MINLKSILKTICLMGIMGIFLYSFSLAAETNGVENIFEQAYQTMHTTFEGARSVVYVLSGFGLIGVAIGALMGKLDFVWLASICAALAVLAGAESIVDYAIKDVETDTSYVGIGEDDFDLGQSGLQFS